MNTNVFMRWDNHCGILVSALQQMRQLDTFMDCVIVVEGRKVRVHKVILAAFSPYFELILKEHCNYPMLPMVVVATGVSYESVKLLVDYMYNGAVNVQQEEMGALLRAAKNFQVKGIGETMNTEHAHPVEHSHLTFPVGENAGCVPNGHCPVQVPMTVPVPVPTSVPLPVPNPCLPPAGMLPVRNPQPPPLALGVPVPVPAPGPGPSHPPPIAVANPPSDDEVVVEEVRRSRQRQRQRRSTPNPQGSAPAPTAPAPTAPAPMAPGPMAPAPMAPAPMAPAPMAPALMAPALMAPALMAPALMAPASAAVLVAPAPASAMPLAAPPTMKLSASPELSFTNPLPPLEHSFSLGEPGASDGIAHAAPVPSCSSAAALPSTASVFDSAGKTLGGSVPSPLAVEVNSRSSSPPPHPPALERSATPVQVECNPAMDLSSSSERLHLRLHATPSDSRAPSSCSSSLESCLRDRCPSSELDLPESPTDRTFMETVSQLLMETGNISAGVKPRRRLGASSRCSSVSPDTMAQVYAASPPLSPASPPSRSTSRPSLNTPVNRGRSTARRGVPLRSSQANKAHSSGTKAVSEQQSGDADNPAPAATDAQEPASKKRRSKDTSRGRMSLRNRKSLLPQTCPPEKRMKGTRCALNGAAN